MEIEILEEYPKIEKLQLIKQSKSSNLLEPTPFLSLKKFANSQIYESIEIENDPEYNPNSLEESKVFLKLIQMEFDPQLCKFVIEKNKNIFATNSYENLLEIFIDKIIQEQQSLQIKTQKDKTTPLQKLINSLLINKKNKKLQNLKEIEFSFLDEKLIEEQVSCNICCNSFNKSDWDSLTNCIEISNCLHKFCKNCTQEYIKNLIVSGDVLQIKCPEFTCQTILSQSEINTILNNEVLFQKYKKFYKIKELSKNPNIVWCINQNCDNYTIGSKDNLKINCNCCGTSTCFNCRSHYHEGISCEKALDKEYREYAKKMLVKQCPKCRSRIEKNEGCNHMTCWKCSYQFCWICMGKYKSGKYINNIY